MNSREMLLKSIHHDGSALYVSAENPQIGDTVSIRLRIPSALPLDKVFIRHCPDGEQHFIEMKKGSDHGLSCLWEGLLKIHEPRNNYRFLLVEGGNALWYNGQGISQATPPDIMDFFINGGECHPSWLDTAVFYQIFPDRFRRATAVDRKGVLAGRGVDRAWGEHPLTHQQASHKDFFGGNLAGIQEAVNYFDEMGINALYLNPIFASPSNHRYDTVDYFNVDPSVGGNRALKELSRTLHEKGIRIILDITPNHCGILHPWFQDVLFNSNAPTAEFFTFHSHPQQYEVWNGVRTLPKLNYQSRRLRGIMYGNRNSAMRKWLREPYGIDGWRIDVANMLARQGPLQLAHEVGREIRKAVKEEKPDAYLLGEHFFDGSSHLQGDELDGSMNYHGFAFPFWNWLAPSSLWWCRGVRGVTLNRLGTGALLATWKNFMSLIPWSTARRQFNFLGTHDTPRILSLLEGNVRMAKMAAVMLFTFPGVPSLYYGDETGLLGGHDPGCRGCMVWERETWNNDLRDHYRKLISLRRESDTLASGSFEVLLDQSDLFAFKRESLNEAYLVLMNRSGESSGRIHLPAGLHGAGEGMKFHEVFAHGSCTVKDGILEVGSVPAESALLLRAGKNGHR